MMPQKKIRVLVIERQTAMIEKIRAFFELRPDMEMADADGDVRALTAKTSRTRLKNMIELLQPDVVITDLCEPVNSELLRISRLQELTGVPVIAFTNCILSDRDGVGTHFFEVVRRPELGSERDERRALMMLSYAVRRAKMHVDTAKASRSYGQGTGWEKKAGDLIVIGASAGGTDAIINILSALPSDMPPILVVQHITRGFAGVFANHIDRVSRLTASVAINGEIALNGHVYVAPDAVHLTVEEGTFGYLLCCSRGEHCSGHIPSVDILFNSAAECAGSRAIGVILTGMGRDGAAGLLRMRQAGACTIGQDAATSLVYGMPRAAWELGAVEKQLGLELIAGELQRCVHERVKWP